MIGEKTVITGFHAEKQPILGHLHFPFGFCQIPWKQRQKHYDGKKMASLINDLSTEGCYETVHDGGRVVSKERCPSSSSFLSLPVKNLKEVQYKNQ